MLRLLNQQRSTEQHRHPIYRNSPLLPVVSCGDIHRNFLYKPYSDYGPVWCLHFGCGDRRSGWWSSDWGGRPGHLSRLGTWYSSGICAFCLHVAHYNGIIIIYYYLLLSFIRRSMVTHYQWKGYNHKLTFCIAWELYGHRSPLPDSPGKHQTQSIHKALSRHAQSSQFHRWIRNELQNSKSKKFKRTEFKLWKLIVS